jgi:hypothetical protein
MEYPFDIFNLKSIYFQQVFQGAEVVGLKSDVVNEKKRKILQGSGMG